jgi:hypothetical protein
MMSNSKPLPCYALLRHWFQYHPETGIVAWRRHAGGQSKAGKVAGHPSKTRGHVEIRLKGKIYQAHRLIWKLYYGKDPGPLEVDHINGIRHDNRISNLRLATRPQNQWNTGLSKRNTSGIKGVSYESQRKRWCAQLERNKKTIHIGYFNTIEEAAHAVCLKREELDGEWTNHG